MFQLFDLQQLLPIEECILCSDILLLSTVKVLSLAIFDCIAQEIQDKGKTKYIYVCLSNTNGQILKQYDIINELDQTREKKEYKFISNSKIKYIR